MTPGKRIAALLLVVLALAACSRLDGRSSDSASASESPSESAKAGPLSGRTIAVDAGHNGGNADHPEVINEKVDVLTGKKPCNTVGTQTDDGYTEHEFNFSVAAQLVERLESAGAKVVTTRDDDDGVGPCIDERAEVGNKAHADVSVSIHADGGPDDGRGFHIMEPVLIKGHTDEIVKPSQRLAKRIAKTYADSTGIPPSDYIGDEGINPRDDMGGLNLSTVPVVMVECGNMRNSKDAKLLSDKDFHGDIAEGIADGIVDYLESALSILGQKRQYFVSKFRNVYNLHCLNLRALRRRAMSTVKDPDGNGIPEPANLHMSTMRRIGRGGPLSALRPWAVAVAAGPGPDRRRGRRTALRGQPAARTAQRGDRQDPGAAQAAQGRHVRAEPDAARVDRQAGGR
ncbi:N-acetylmuramoyl-L-alanine amidase [Stackebrandtia nassauensis]|uniref:N-acetylmuramoyl-L-alanine amidase n=1 Tax=Stackebrandtia nassauensis TaxID=283811 RepID=UPI0009FFCE00|nr:N-acetylmuramoyl-L-alanine amidase [Stackebrandtia nassauensis]